MVEKEFPTGPLTQKKTPSPSGGRLLCGNQSGTVVPEGCSFPCGWGISAHRNGKLSLVRVLSQVIRRRFLGQGSSRPSCSSHLSSFEGE